MSMQFDRETRPARLYSGHVTKLDFRHLSTLLDTALFVFRSSWVLAACIVAWLTCLGTCVLDQRRAAYWPPGWQQIEADKNGDALIAWFQNNRPARRLSPLSIFETSSLGFPSLLCLGMKQVLDRFLTGFSWSSCFWCERMKDGLLCIDICANSSLCYESRDVASVWYTASRGLVVYKAMPLQSCWTSTCNTTTSLTWELWPLHKP